MIVREFSTEKAALEAVLEDRNEWCKRIEPEIEPGGMDTLTAFARDFGDQKSFTYWINDCLLAAAFVIERDGKFFMLWAEEE